MSAIRIAGFAAASLMVGAIGFAQSSNQTSSDTNIAKADMSTVVGCLMKESDYRAAHGIGKGAFGGAGIGDEYVLVNASVMPAAAASPSSNNDASAPASSAASASASTMCSETGNGLAFRPTGPREHGMEALLGQRVAVTGKLEHGGREANSREGHLPEEIRVSSFSVAPAVSEQAAVAPAPEPAAAAPAPQVEAQNNAQPPAENPPAASNNEQPVGTSGNLPRTAGESSLIGLIGLLSLGAGIGLTLLRRTAAVS